MDESLRLEGTEITVKTEEGILEDVEKQRIIYKYYNLKYKKVVQADKKVN